MPRLEIIGVAFSNYVWTCRIAAAKKGVPCEHVDVWPHTDLPKAIHPLGKVPVMRHGEVTLAESRAICLYMDRVFDGPSLLPAEPLAAARVEQWISIVNTAVDPVCMRQYVLGYVVPRTPDKSPDRPRIDGALPAMRRLLGVLDAAVADGGLGGPDFSLADAFALPITYFVGRFPEGAEMLAGLPRLSAWLDRGLARPSVAAAMPPPMG